MQNALDRAKKSLEDYYEQKKGEIDEKTYNLVCDYFNWIKMKTEMISKEKDFKVPEGMEIRRGDVFWVNFGYNIDEEFGGKHPAIVLRVGGRTAIVIPLSTKEPSQSQMDSGIYVEIKRVYEFENLRRWVNVLNAMPISIQRFEFAKKGNVKGWELDNISIAMENSKLWKLKPKNV